MPPAHSTEPPASEPPAAPSDTAAAQPPAEQAAPTEQANQETNPETKPDTATTAAAAPLAEAHHKPTHRHRLAAKPPRARQARAFPPGSQPSGIGGPFVPPANR